MPCKYVAYVTRMLVELTCTPMFHALLCSPLRHHNQTRTNHKTRLERGAGSEHPGYVVPLQSWEGAGHPTNQYKTNSVIRAINVVHKGRALSHALSELSQHSIELSPHLIIVFLEPSDLFFLLGHFCFLFFKTRALIFSTLVSQRFFFSRFFTFASPRF